MKGFVRIIAGLAAVGLWIWLWHGLSAVPDSVKSTSTYLVGSFVAFSVVTWIVGKAFEVFTGQA